jgi:hypothetical protein
MTVDGWRPNRPLEHIIEASGTVGPNRDRGSMHWTLLPITDESGTEVSPRLDADLRWDSKDFWLTSELSSDAEWKHTSRARAPEVAIVSRAPEEPLALLRFVSAAKTSAMRPLPDASLDGKTAHVWLVEVAAADATAAYVPPDSYQAVERIYGPVFPVEVWLVDGVIMRTGYVLERDKAPYGGPDRHETWYDWSNLDEPFDVKLPPAGKIFELK